MRDIAQNDRPPVSCECQNASAKPVTRRFRISMPLKLHGENQLTGFQSSEKVRRGFGPICGAARSSVQNR